ncbi:MAG: hypothetical protein ACE5LF_04680 [Alphaproteobacteria bacterium]
MTRRPKSLLPVLAAAIALPLLAGGCATKIPDDALKLTEESLELRQLQTRRFDTGDEGMLLSAIAAVLQDLGFTLDESEPDIGVVVASKDRDAVEAGQVALAIFVALLGSSMPIDKHQKMRASVVTWPLGDESRETAVRVTFQRLVWNDRGVLWKRQTLDDPQAYQEFFARLSKAIFLEAHSI